MRQVVNGAVRIFRAVHVVVLICLTTVGTSRLHRVALYCNSYCWREPAALVSQLTLGCRYC